MLSKSYYCSCNLQNFKTWVFLEKKWLFFAKISLKDFRSTIWHFSSKLRVRLSYCFGILKTIKFLVCLEKQMLSLKRSLFFSRIDKRGIFIPACVSKDIISQENWKRSTAWDFRESRLVIWKNCLNFLKNADIGKIYIECVSDGFLTKNSQKLQTLDFLGETGRFVWKIKPEFLLKPISWACLIYNLSQIVFLLKKSQRV